MSDFMLAAGLGPNGSINVMPAGEAGARATWVPFRGAYFTPEGYLITTDNGTPVVRNPNGVAFAADGSMCTCTSGGVFTESANMLLDSVGRVQVFEGTDAVPNYTGVPLNAAGALCVTSKGGNPANLFAAGEVGAWYDPSDLSTLFQDAAGTTPVTAVEQPVGLMLDKSGRGNHASQSTSTSRPLLSARVNLLTKTEDITDAAWGKQNGPVIAANATYAPDGTLTADSVTNVNAASAVAFNQNQTLSAATTCTISFHVKAGTTAAIQFGAYAGAFLSASARVVYGPGSISGSTLLTLSGLSTSEWTRIEYNVTGTGAVTTLNFYPETAGVGTGKSIYFWGADLRVANDGVGIPAYQRVNTSTDYDTAGFPLYLRADGVDDWLQTGAINFSATDKMTVWAGVRKLSDAGTAALVELSIDAGGLAGSFALFAAYPANGYTFRSQGTILADAQTGTTFTSPITNVVTGIGDIASDNATLRINATQAATSSADQGTGKYGTYPLYLFRRGGTSFTFNGRLYSLIVRGAASTASQIAATETWVNTRTKAY